MAGNTNDWRLQHEPDLRQRVFHIIYGKFKIWFPHYSHNEISKMAGKIEDRIYGIAKDKDDYAKKIEAELNLTEQQSKIMQTLSAINATKTQNSGAQLVLNPGQSVPTQTPTSQQNINLSAASQWQQLLPPQQAILGSQSGQSVPTQTPTSQQWLPHMQQQAQHQHLINAQVFKYINAQILLGNFKLPHMQQQAQPQPQQHLQSLLKQPIHQSFPQSSIFSSVPSSANQNSQLVPSQNIGEQQGAFRPSYQAMAPQSNLQTMHQQQQRMPGSQSAARDFKGKGVVIGSGRDWQEEAYQRIQALKQKHFSILTHMLQRHREILQEPESLPPQMMQPGFIESLRRNILLIEQILEFLQVHRSNISEMHRDMFSLCEENILIITEGCMQQQQEQFSPSQTYVTELKSQLNKLQQMYQQTSVPHSFQTRPMLYENNTLASSRDVVLPSITQNPSSNLQVIHSNINPIQSSMLQQMHQPASQSKQPTQQESQQLQMMTSKQGLNYSSGPASSTQLIDQQIFPATVNETAIPSQSIGSPFVGPSPVTSLTPSSFPGDPENPIPDESPVSHSQSSSSFGVESSTPEQPPKPIAEQPIDGLTKAFQSSSPGSCQSVGGSRVRSREYLSASTSPNKRMKLSVNDPPLENSIESEVKKTESNCVLTEEIKEINSKLAETMVKICNEDVESGTIIMCSYTPVDFNGQILQIQPLGLLVPANYPNSSPTLLNEIPFAANSGYHEDLSAGTRSRFILSLKKLSEPLSLQQIARVWDDSAKATMVEYETSHGGGTSSSK